MASTPLADDVTTSDATLGGIAAILVETSETRSDRVVLYLHGGAYALGSAPGRRWAGLRGRSACEGACLLDRLPLGARASLPGRRRRYRCRRIAACSTAASTRGRSRSLANRPERGCVAATLVSGKGGWAAPAGVRGLMSPWRGLDAHESDVGQQGRRRSAPVGAGAATSCDEYVTRRTRAASPLFADLSGRPAVVQAGSHDILLGDAMGLARRVAECDGRVGLDVWPDVPHVFRASRAARRRRRCARLRWACSSTAGSARSIPRGLLSEARCSAR